MKAIRIYGPQDLRLVEVPDPVAREGFVIVRVRASGICGSDKWLWRVTGPVEGIHGHEVAGEVVGIGPSVKRLKIGDRVAVNNVVGCGHCPACRRGAFVLCPHWNGQEDVNGGYGEYVATPERNCLVLDDRLDFETGCLIFDNFGTPYGALERGGVKGPGDDVVVTGCGPIGLGAVALASLRGAYVIAVDPLSNRRELALRLGAQAALPPGEDLLEAVRDLTDGLGVSYVLECSGKSPVYGFAFQLLRPEGKLVSVGEGAAYEMRPSDLLIRKALTQVGSWYSTMSQGARVQELVVQGKIHPKALVNLRGTLVEFPFAFRQAVESPERVIKAVIES